LALETFPRGAIVSFLPGCIRQIDLAQVVPKTLPVRF
jgi:hypothetical protein